MAGRPVGPRGELGTGGMRADMGPGRGRKMNEAQHVGNTLRL